MRAAAVEARLDDGPRPAWALALAIAAAALAWDPAAPAADPKRLLLLVAAAVALATARRRDAPLDVSPAAALFVAFVGLGALSLAWGGGHGWRDLVTLGAAALLLAGAALRPRADAAALARATASLLGGGAALWTLAQAVTGAGGFALHGGQGNPNWLGLLLAATLPLSLSALLGAPRGARAEKLLALLVLPQIPALLLAQSRTAWVALAVAGVATLADPRAPLRRHAGLALAAALGGGAALLVAHGGALHALGGRIWIWRIAAHAAAAALPWGGGLGAFPGRFLDLQGDALAALPAAEAAHRFVNATSAHDDWLEIATETGLPGLFLFAAAIGAGVVACRRAGARAEAATLIAFAVTALADSPLRQPAVLVPVALALASAPRTLPFAAGARRAVPLAAGLGLAAAAALLPIAASSWLGAHLATAARDADPDRKLALLARAARVDPRSGEIAFAAGIAHLERGEPEAALAALERSRPLLPQVATEVAIGNTHLVAGRADDAAAAYQRALRLDPGSFRAHTNLAVALRRLGRDREAELHLATARRLYPHHPVLAELAADSTADD
ncbi:MAG TPA: tetratricopeptide repeat protein [Polyangia bacterium]|jgi:tetratricopeptide (TPR) repeat protein